MKRGSPHYLMQSRTHLVLLLLILIGVWPGGAAADEPETEWVRDFLHSRGMGLDEIVLNERKAREIFDSEANVETMRRLLRKAADQPESLTSGDRAAVRSVLIMFYMFAPERGFEVAKPLMTTSDWRIREAAASAVAMSRNPQAPSVIATQIDARFGDLFGPDETARWEMENLLQCAVIVEEPSRWEAVIEGLRKRVEAERKDHPEEAEHAILYLQDLQERCNKARSPRS